MKRAVYKTLLILVFFPLAACPRDKVPGGRIIIRNDILDKEYNSFTVDQVLVGGSFVGFRKIVHPNEAITIPHKHIRSLRFSRSYKDHTKIYIVDCPEEMDSQVTMNLIDVHSNKIAGGCTLVKRGEMRNGATRWEDKEKRE